MPYLIDHARNFAALVSLWLEHTTIGEENIPSTESDLLKFHHLCLQLQQRTTDCLERAEHAERPSSGLSFQWEELVDRLEAFQNGGVGRGSTESSMRPEREELPRTESDTYNTTPTASKTFRNPGFGPLSTQHAGSHPSSASHSQYATSSAASAASVTPPGSAGHAESTHESDVGSASAFGGRWEPNAASPGVAGFNASSASNSATVASSSLPTNSTHSTNSSKHSRKPPSLGSRSQNSANYKGDFNTIPTPNQISFYDHRNNNMQLQNSTPTAQSPTSSNAGPGSGSRSLESSVQNLVLRDIAADRSFTVPPGPMSPGSDGGGETTALPRFDRDDGPTGRKGSFMAGLGFKRRKEKERDKEGTAR